MKAHITYIFLFLVILLLFNVSANSIPEYTERRVKRDDTTTPGVNGEVSPDVPPLTNPETTKNPDPIVTSQEVPTTTKETTISKSEETTTSKTSTTGDSPTTSSNIEPTSTSDNNNNNDNNNTIDNNIGNNNSTDTTVITPEKKKGGLSGGIIAVIVVGGIFALGVVILLLRALLKLCTRKRYEDPLPVNVVSNTASTEQLNPQNNIGQDSSQYYNNPSQYSSQTGNNIPNTGTVVGINESQQPYYQQNYENGVDISNSQYQNQNGYSSDIASNSGNSNGMMEYPQPNREQLLVPPVRQFSSLRRPTANGGRSEILPDDVNMANGDITESSNVKPHKVVINKSNNTPIEPGTIHKTQFPFNPTMDDELRLNQGDAVEIIEVYDDGWSYGKNMATNELGVFPISYITGYNDPSNNF
ncbi:hypothetical protein BCR32DRAFT_289644 [Anaeromyces robustus]|uniref:SH3 domain-containing protein n=1 Tax=Anaeromyces robustus TaxID=1754192 RepID=A0A1Y1XN98_9FUNG|nr:hypothetical protein BCR32DRAFT_289644 [Anaeromyces robustus]|eukprot:ORX86976.1 hypothetical protein BCR32DRAFT_289644 [Anaeromyces robustus]